MKRLRSSRGFTMVELLTVMAILVILASMGLVQYKNSVQRANEAVLKEDLFRMHEAIDQYYADKAKYPADLSALVSEGYIREVPTDPFTQSKDTWATEPAEPDANNPSSAPGIYKVHSGSDRLSLDGKPYSEW